MRIFIESTDKAGDFNIAITATPHDKAQPGPGDVISVLLLVANSLVIQHTPKPPTIAIAGAGALPQLDKKG